MGCVSSKQATQPRQPMAQPEEEEIQTSVVSTKASTIRARRLSYSVEANAGHLRPSLRAGPEDGEDDEELDEGKANSPTRARRLSYCAKEPRLAGRIRAEYAMYGDDGSSSGSSSQTPLAVTPTAAATGGEAAARPSKPRPVGVQVACMSRAGREPGYKKTNQDNCFAFEKYISEEQSMFGAMDGHGPHGHLVSGFVKQHLPIILVNHLTSGVSVEDALTTGFLEVDRNLASSRIDCEFSGSTCAVAYLKVLPRPGSWSCMRPVSSSIARGTSMQQAITVQVPLICSELFLASAPSCEPSFAHEGRCIYTAAAHVGLHLLAGQDPDNRLGG
eukprot:GHRR01011442.1.p1 GENE.GHRR01011442.1~~GHRR01011442.1.p1  ORF type:complete len:331 (+),score=62.98 GHRR01011442.1:198-1190(+)